MSDSDDSEIGYGKPPRNTRFQKGQSGNPKGRPKKKQKGRALEAVLGRSVPMSIGGKNSIVSMTEAIALTLAKGALDGNDRSARYLLDKADKNGPSEVHQPITMIRRIIVDPKECNVSLSALGVVKDVDNCYRIEPWVIEAALQRNPSLTFKQSELALLSNSVVDGAALQKCLRGRTD
jgi:hypothetical protein